MGASYHCFYSNIHGGMTLVPVWNGARPEGPRNSDIVGDSSQPIELIRGRGQGHQNCAPAIVGRLRLSSYGWKGPERPGALASKPAYDVNPTIPAQAPPEMETGHFPFPQEQSQDAPLPNPGA